MNNPSARSIAKDIRSRFSSEVDLKDTGRRYSYGKDQDSMLGADRTGIQAGYKITNDTGVAHTVYISPFTVLGQTVDVGTNTVVPKLGTTDVLFATGAQLVSGADSFEITELDSEMPITSIRGVAEGGGLQIASLHMKSRGIVAHVASTADDSNYENPITYYWINPFDKIEKDTYQLRLLQDSYMNSPQFAKVDFLLEERNVLISTEHVVAIKVNPRTELTITVGVGAQNSSPQRFWRDTRDANKVLSGIRRMSAGAKTK